MICLSFLIQSACMPWRFKELVSSWPISGLRTPEEAAAAASANSEADGQKTEGEDPANAAKETSRPVSSSLKDAEELEKYISIREELYKEAKEFDSKIIGFETAIKRPYFHVRPFNVVELENWYNYLDFIEGGDDFNKNISKICRQGWRRKAYQGPCWHVNVRSCTQE